jgi:hypothetical protein
MSAFELDPDTGEHVRTNGRLVRISGAASIVQALRVAWRTILGECVFDPSRGLPLFELGAQATPTQRVEQLLAEEGLRVPGIVALDLGEPTLDKATRRLEVEFTGEASVDDQNRRVRLEGQTTVPIG